MINELYINKLISLIKKGLITLDDIKVEEYKIEIQTRFAQQGD